MIGRRCENMCLSPLHHLKRARRDMRVLRAFERRAGRMGTNYWKTLKGKMGRARSQMRYRRC